MCALVKEGISPLTIACQNENTEIAKLLIDKGADITASCYRVCESERSVRVRVRERVCVRESVGE